MTSVEEALVRRSDVVLSADPRRVLARPFLPGRELLVGGSSRADAVVGRVLALSEEGARNALRAVQNRFADRHADLDAVLDDHADRIAELVAPLPATLTTERRRLIGAYGTMEFAVEAAALFNPSMVAAPDQTGLRVGETRFVLSVRAVGEGHVSSIEFRSGVLGAGGVRVDPPHRHLRKGVVTALGPQVLPGRDTSAARYRLTFPAAQALSSRILFPTIPAERQGMEDARFTRFVDDDASVRYLGTYTAFDGERIAARLLETKDFLEFGSRPLVGQAARDKGMALFPRRIGGDFAALTRWDRESIGVSRSSDGIRWDSASTVQAPAEEWAVIQLGNCGPPIETDAGWLVLTHGVGAMRRYAIGAILLDRDRPEVVRGALSEALLTPDAAERDGYVPNVVYSCGAMAHGAELVIPYGCSDSSIRFAYVDLPGLLDRLA